MSLSLGLSVLGPAAQDAIVDGAGVSGSVGSSAMEAQAAQVSGEGYVGNEAQAQATPAVSSPGLYGRRALGRVYAHAHEHTDGACLGFSGSAVVRVQLAPKPAVAAAKVLPRPVAAAMAIDVGDLVRDVVMAMHRIEDRRRQRVRRADVDLMDL